MEKKDIPVITIDGPSGSGKGVISKKIAKKLNWHLLDSGALYRILAFSGLKNEIDLTNENELAKLAPNLDINFLEDDIFLDGHNISNDIRTEEIGAFASKIASYKKVRELLLLLQRSFLKEPGLVADGRDMGTVVFPDAKLKIFLDATPFERAKRRYLQLKSKGYDVSLKELEKEVARRDFRDRNRAIAPLKAAFDATVIDTTNLNIEEVFLTVLSFVDKVDF